MSERRKRSRLCPSMDARLDAIRMTPSERAQARQALALGMRAAEFITATKRGLRWLFQGPVARRARRQAAAPPMRSGDAAAPHASAVLRNGPQSTN